MRPLSLLLLLSLAACGDDDGSTPDIDAGAPDGGAAAFNCEASDEGCLCANFAADELEECSADSIAGPLQAGYCCRGEVGGTVYCTCETVECRTDGTSCTCGRTASIPDTWTPTGSCNGAHCCLTGFGCFCSSLTCQPGETEVGSCGTADVTNCGTDLDETDDCLASP